MSKQGKSKQGVPEAWIGQRVEALIVQPWGTQTGSRSLTAWLETGVLEGVNKRGIVATFEEDEPPESAFYPWSAVLRLRAV
jgi:hypothetical protein